ncbi:hypothetical protein K3495_g1966 [Podosphaera aphanis]|nr:hypothetical protein K3495_g1966 [Podosphaera aphanis]
MISKIGAKIRDALTTILMEKVILLTIRLAGLRIERLERRGESLRDKNKSKDKAEWAQICGQEINQRKLKEAAKIAAFQEWESSWKQQKEKQQASHQAPADPKTWGAVNLFKDKRSDRLCMNYRGTPTEIYRNLNRAQSSIAIQLRSEHVGLNSYLYCRKVPGVETPACQCGYLSQNVRHMVMTCPNTTRITPTELLHGKKTNEPLDLVKLPIDETPHRKVTALTVGLSRSTRLENPAQKVIGCSNSMQNSSTSDDLEDSLISNKGTTRISQVKNDKAITSRGDMIYNPNRVEAADAIAIASMSIKKYYDDDDRHMPMFFNTADFVMLRLHRGYTIPSAKLTTKKLQRQFVGPFRITERIGKLAYKLAIPKIWKIHPVVTIA